MTKRMSLTLVFVLLMAGVLTACGGGAPAPVTYSQVPLFTGATESTNAAVVSALGGMLDQLKAESTIQGTEGKAYDVPAGTTWDMVKSFYSTALEKAGWTQAKMNDANTNLGYARGKQAVNVLFADGIGLIVILSEAK
jgi:prepilin-type processing-associated H-X9-DG protein